MRRKTGLLLVILLVALTGTTGCGVIVHGSAQDIMINAPNDVLVKALDNEGTQVSAQTKGSTVLNLKRSKDHTITAEKDGSSTSCGQVRKSLSGGILFADILWNPLIWGLTDWLTGGWNNLEPTVVTCHVSDSPKSVIEKKTEPKTSERKIEPQIIKKNPEPQSDSASKLSKLKELYDAGLISQDEYKAKRTKILEGL